MTPENRIVDTPAAEATAPEGDASAELQPNDYATGFVAGYLRAQGAGFAPTLPQFREALDELSRHLAEIRHNAH